MPPLNGAEFNHASRRRLPSARPKRQGTGALQDATRGLHVASKRYASWTAAALRRFSPADRNAIPASPHLFDATLRRFDARLRPGEPSLRRFDGSLHRFDAILHQNGG